MSFSFSFCDFHFLHLHFLHLVKVIFYYTKSFLLLNPYTVTNQSLGDGRSRSVTEKSSRVTELPSEILVEEEEHKRAVPGSGMYDVEFQIPTTNLGRNETRQEVERIIELRSGAGRIGPDLSSASEFERNVVQGGFGSENQFKSLLPDSHQQFDTLTSDLTTGSVSSTDESSVRFKKFAPIKASSGIKTYSVTIDGDLVSEHSDSERSTMTGRQAKHREELSSYSVSSVDESTQKLGVTEDSQGFSFGVKDSVKTDHVPDLCKSSIPNASDLSEQSEESQPKSSSFTNVSSDPSLSSMITSTLSQYTFQTEDQSGVPNLTQYTIKSEDATETPDLSQYSLKSSNVIRKSDDKTMNASTEEGSNYLQQKFASLDNLISESKSLIARHKVLVDKNKEMESKPQKTSVEESVVKPEREVAPGVQGITAQESNVKSR